MCSSSIRSHHVAGNAGQQVWSQLSSDPTLTGFSEEQAAVVTRKVLEIILQNSMQVGPVQPQPQQQTLEQQQLQQAQPHANQDASRAADAASNDDEELTEVELSDEEAEAASLNAEEKGEAAPCKVKRVTKAAKKRILLKKTSKGIK